MYVIRGDRYYRLILYTNDYKFIWGLPLLTVFMLGDRVTQVTADTGSTVPCILYENSSIQCCKSHDWLQCALLLRKLNDEWEDVVHVHNYQCVYKPKTSTLVCCDLLLVACMWTVCLPLAIQTTKNATRSAIDTTPHVCAPCSLHVVLPL